MSSSSKRLEPTTFEFAKRKHWADLLITELSEAIILVLGPTAKIWYCNPAVHELLGWTDEELIDVDLTDILNGEFPPPPFADAAPARGGGVI